MMIFNRDRKEFYKKSLQIFFMIWICVLGYSKIQVVKELYAFAVMLNENDEYPEHDQHDVGQIDKYNLQFFGGFVISIPLLIKLNYNRSRRLIIILAECSYIVGLSLIIWDKDYHLIPLGFSFSLSLFIYPLYLYEQSYGSGYENLANFLQFSSFFAVLFNLILFQTQIFVSDESSDYTFTTLQVMTTMICISLLNIILFLYPSYFKETIMSLYMNDRQDIGKELINKLIKEDDSYVTNFFTQERNKRLQLQNPELQLLTGQLEPLVYAEDTRVMKTKQLVKNIIILIFSLIMSLSYIFSNEFINIYSYNIKNENLIITLLALFRSCIAYLICYFINHEYILKRGFLFLLILFFFKQIRYNEEVDYFPKCFYILRRYFEEFMMYCTINSIWRIRVFSTLSLQWIWIHQLVFCFACYFRFSENYLPYKDAIEFVTYLVGFILIKFN